MQKLIKQFFGVSNKVNAGSEINAGVEDDDSCDEEKLIEKDSDHSKSKSPELQEANESEKGVNVDDEEDLRGTIEKTKSNFAGKDLEYFENGCFAKTDEKLSPGSNYSCAIDSFSSFVESILSSGNFKAVNKVMEFSPLLQEVKKILLHRLRNMLSWSHFLRNSLWNLMASSFPETIAPIGKVTASVDEAVQELGKLWPIQVIVNTVCSEPECGKNLGKFSCVFDYILTLSSPLKGPLKDTNYSLCDLIVDRISHYVKNILRHKIRCIYCGGFPQHTGVALSNLKIPSFLFLNFILVEGGSNNMFNDFKDSCLLEPYLQLESLNLELLSAVMSSQMHFFTISKLFGSFYKFDNMIVNACAHPFSSFEEAYCQKSKQKAAPFYLNRRSVRPKK